MSNTTKLKALETQIKHEEENLELLQKNKKEIDIKIDLSNKQLKQFRAEKRRLLDNNKDIVISEHAILRYLERVKKIDMESLKKEILTEQISKDLKAIGNCSYSIKGFKLIYRDNTIITVE